MAPPEDASLTTADDDRELRPSPAGAPLEGKKRPVCGRDLVLVLPAAIAAVLYAETSVRLAEVWETDPTYSHGFVVPGISLAFAVLAWNRYGSPVRSDVSRGAFWTGTLEVALGLALHAVAWFASFLLLDVLSLIFVVRGTLMALGGREANRGFGFAALFLIFMAPLPSAWYQPLAIAMQQLVSAISTQFLELCGAAVYREGYMIHLPGYTMEVGEACSGLRQLMAVFALSVAIGYFSGRKAPYRWALALLSFPIAIAANCVRVMLTGVIMMLFGAKWAEGVFHTLEGLVIVGLAAVLVVAVAAGLARVDDHFRRAGQRAAGERA